MRLLEVAFCISRGSLLDYRNWMRQKHIPERTCVVCRGKMDKRSLTRIVRSPVGGIIADPSGKLNGRGAYLCMDNACWDKALTGNILDKHLLTNISEAERAGLTKYRPDSRAGSAKA